MFSRKIISQPYRKGSFAARGVVASAVSGVIAAVCCLGLVACGGGGREGAGEMVVSIEPLRYIVEGITGDDFKVVTLTPPGSNPETYEPTPSQIAAAEGARLIFSTGLVAFERELVGRLPRPERSVDLSAGVPLIESDHGHAHDHEEEREHEHGHARAEADPHIWMSPRALALMAETAYRHIHEMYPDSTSYTANYARLAERLTRLDAEVSRRLAASRTRSFMILHPGLTYYARDYGLRQIAIERDGKEPSVGQLAQTVAEARAEGVSLVLFQSEFPVRTVEVAAAELGCEPVEIDILGYDVAENILKITDLIAK